MSAKKTKTPKPTFSVAIGRKNPVVAEPALNDSQEKVAEQLSSTPAVVAAPQGAALERAAVFFNMDKEPEDNTETTKPPVISVSDNDIDAIAEKESKRPTSLRLAKPDYVFEEKVFRGSTYKSKQQMRRTIYLAGLAVLAKQIKVDVPEGYDQ